VEVRWGGRTGLLEAHPLSPLSLHGRTHVCHTRCSRRRGFVFLPGGVLRYFAQDASNLSLWTPKGEVLVFGAKATDPYPALALLVQRSIDGEVCTAVQPYTMLVVPDPRRRERWLEVLSSHASGPPPPGLRPARSIVRIPLPPTDTPNSMHKGASGPLASDTALRRRLF
jgi:hypothetical protein